MLTFFARSDFGIEQQHERQGPWSPRVQWSSAADVGGVELKWLLVELHCASLLARPSPCLTTVLSTLTETAFKSVRKSDKIFFCEQSVFYISDPALMRAIATGEVTFAHAVFTTVVSESR